LQLLIEKTIRKLRRALPLLAFGSGNRDSEDPFERNYIAF